MAAQLTIDGREVQPAAAPERCEVLPLFSAPQTIPGQLPCPMAPETLSAPRSEPQPVKRSTSAADPEHRARMMAGAERARIEREQRSCARVEAFRSWLRRGSPAREIPEVPRDADFATAREHGRDRAS